MKRDEDQEQTLIFVDMLGFAALIEKHPRRIETDQYAVYTAPTQSKFNRFDHVLDCCINDQRRDGRITAMLFSDCAFLKLGNSLRAASIATDLMRKFIKETVSVRMGIGKGTFCSFGYSTDAGGGLNAGHQITILRYVRHTGACRRKMRREGYADICAS